MRPHLVQGHRRFGACKLDLLVQKQRYHRLCRSPINRLLSMRAGPHTAHHMHTTTNTTCHMPDPLHPPHATHHTLHTHAHHAHRTLHMTTHSSHRIPQDHLPLCTPPHTTSHNGASQYTRQGHTRPYRTVPHHTTQHYTKPHGTTHTHTAPYRTAPHQTALYTPQYTLDKCGPVHILQRRELAGSPEDGVAQDIGRRFLVLL